MPKIVEVNKNFFKKWSFDMAYVLGFFTADGCLTINPRGAHFIEFTNTDGDILEKIKRAMGSKHKISKRIPRNKNWRDSFRIQIGSKEMFNDLIELGFSTNKSKTVTLPKIPKKYFTDYLRGYFDGDGCICYANYFRKQRNKYYKHIVITFTSGSRQLLEQLARQINQCVGINIPKIIYSRGYRLYYLNNNAIQLIKFIYNQPNIYLNKKFIKSQKALKFHLDR